MDLIVRARWMAYVAIAFVAGWLGGMEYVGRNRDARFAAVEPIPPDSQRPESPVTDALSRPSQPANQVEQPARAPLLAKTSPSTETPAEGATGDVTDRTPSPAFDALVKAIEREQRELIARFETEPVNTPWGLRAEQEIRSTFYLRRPLGNSDLESLECRATLCKLVAVNRYETPEQALRARPGSPDDPWGAYAVAQSALAPSADDEKGFRITLYLIAWPPKEAG